MHADQPGEHLDHARRPDAPGHVDGETLARPFVDEGQAFQLLPIRTAIEDEVARPHVIRRHGRRRSWSAGGHPSAEAAARHLQPGGPPQAMQALSADLNALAPEEHLNTSIAVPWILQRERPHRTDDWRVLDGPHRLIPQRRARHPQQRAGASTRQAPLYRVADLPPTDRRAYQCFLPISFMTSISRSRSATSFFRRPFSCSSCRSRFTSAGSSCPNCRRHV